MFTIPALRGLRLLILACILLKFAALNATAEVAPNPNGIVVMISIDGLAGYYLDDPKAEMPTLRKLAAEGARASSMKPSTPTVTWVNHTTLVTGVNPARHGVLGNNYLDRATRKKVTLISDPVYDKDEIVKVPTIYDLAKQAGMKTAGIRWPATRNARTLDWTVPDIITPELLRRFTTPSLAAECEKAGIDLFARDAAGSSAPPPTDENATRAFNLVLREHRPRLALLHVIDVDHTEHLDGPKSPEAYAAVKAADDQVRQVWEELQRDYPGKATLLVVSDHGFSAIEHSILANVILRRAGLVHVSGNKASGGPVQLVSQGGSALVYVLDPAHRADIMSRAREAFANVGGMLKVVESDDFKKYGVADPKDDPRAPDMILFSKEGWNFGDTAAGQLPFIDKPERKGSHGHDADIPDLHATFVAWGAGIKPGARLGEISNLDVAPTIAKLLDLKIPNPDGKPLKAALSNYSVIKSR